MSTIGQDARDLDVGFGVLRGLGGEDGDGIASAGIFG